MSWGWPEQYANMAAGGAAITCAFPNMPKFLDNPGNKDSKIVGKLRTGLAPGRIVDGKLIRRTVWWPNITLAVSTQTKYPEATYLCLQWANSPSMFTFMVGNPAGYYDPFQVSDFKDPVVVGSYHDYHVPTMTSSIEHAVPPLNLNGASEYETALDNNLQAVIAGKKTAEQAMKDAADEWNKITDRLGREKQVAAIAAQAAAYSTVDRHAEDQQVRPRGPSRPRLIESGVCGRERMNEWPRAPRRYSIIRDPLVHSWMACPRSGANRHMQIDVATPSPQQGSETVAASPARRRKFLDMSDSQHLRVNPDDAGADRAAAHHDLPAAGRGLHQHDLVDAHPGRRLDAGLPLLGLGQATTWRSFRTPAFWQAMGRTFLIVGVAVSLEFLIGLGLAFLFMENFPGKKIFYTLMLVPMMIVPAVAGYVFWLFFQSNGPLNAIVSADYRPPVHV